MRCATVVAPSTRRFFDVRYNGVCRLVPASIHSSAAARRIVAPVVVASGFSGSGSRIISSARNRTTAAPTTATAQTKDGGTLATGNPLPVVLPSASSSNNAGGGGGEDEIASALIFKRESGILEQNWCDEPTLDHLDVSIPQVDCRFVAELIRRRREAAALKEKETSKPRGGADDNAGKDANSAAADGSSTGTAASEKTGNADPPPSSAVVDPRSGEGSTRSVHGDDDHIILIDCRTVAEVTSWGMIEGAKLLPAHDLYGALHMTEEEFEANFGFPKPLPSQGRNESDSAKRRGGGGNVGGAATKGGGPTLLLYCQYGPRSLMAAQIAHFLGYRNVVHFRPGYYEWAKQFNKLTRRMMLHDRVSGNEGRRQRELYVGRELGYEIAPEFNDAVRKEAVVFDVDETRSAGKVKAAVPVIVKAIQDHLEVEEDDPQFLPRLEDEARRVTDSRGFGTGTTYALGRESAQNAAAAAARLEARSLADDERLLTATVSKTSVSAPGSEKTVADPRMYVTELPGATKNAPKRQIKVFTPPLQEHVRYTRKGR